MLPYMLYSECAIIRSLYVHVSMLRSATRIEICTFKGEDSGINLDADCHRFDCKLGAT